MAKLWPRKHFRRPERIEYTRCVLKPRSRAHIATEIPLRWKSAIVVMRASGLGGPEEGENSAIPAHYGHACVAAKGVTPQTLLT